MGKIKSLIYLIVERLLARYTDKIVCISNAERISALKHKIAPDRELEVVLNGIDFKAIENPDVNLE